MAMAGFALGLYRRNRTITDVAIVVAILVIPHLPLHTEARYTAGLRLFLALSAAWFLKELLARYWPRLLPLHAGGDPAPSS